MIVLLLCCSWAQADATVEVASVATVEASTIEQGLLSLQDALREKEQEKKLLLRRLKAQSDELLLAQTRQELASAEDIILGLREEIIALAAGGAKLFDEPPVVEEDFDWQKDLELIFEPLLNQLREISERPRLIESLESKIDYWQQRERQLHTAVNNLRINSEQIESKPIKKELSLLLSTAQSRHKSAQQKLSLLVNELAALKQEENPLWTTIGDVVSNLVMLMIAHFFIAVASAFLVYQVVRLLAAVLIFIVSKVRAKQVVFVERTITLARTILGVVLAVLVYLIVLYSFTEWLLLVLSVLILGGLVLGMKEMLPSYFAEVRTLLNLGSVRQGERIVYQGLPWKLSRLNVHTHLHNPALHGHLRVPIGDIVGMSSRPYHSDEPWFPTKVGDVVFVNESIFGEVTRQTPEVVELMFGGAVHSFQTLAFLACSLKNLSHGFTVVELFGIDYQHQPQVTETILATYKNALALRLQQTTFQAALVALTVEFNNASASSLDFKVMLQFNGDIAADYFKIKRWVQATSVDIANEQAWVIPFQQLTVHRAAPL
ncbi:MAG: hypothetical protein KTR20_09910 [Cellvibrionaceae bacterium]|nr:hypothetical protein [Cellvibrionaceae bacterium]